MKLKPAEGDGAAFAGLVLGVSLSVAGNVAHAYVPPKGAPSDWSPEIGLVISSLSWPLLLFWTLEIMLSQRWPTAWYFHVVRWGALGIVAGVAAVVSYQHLSGLLRHWHETEFAWRAGPLAVDGLLIMASTALVVRRLAAGAETTTTKDQEPASPDMKPEPAPPSKPIAKKVATERPARKTTTRQPTEPNDNAKLVLDALPASVAVIATTTGIKRTTVDYVLKVTLKDKVFRDSTRIWREIGTTRLDEVATS